MTQPKLATDASVSISETSAQGLTNFVEATSVGKFSFSGPKPIEETAAGRGGALSMITQDRRLVYQSQAALPPWGAAFTFQTADAEGRFSVVTSSYGNNEPGNWRLAYRLGSGSWNYQSLAGTAHVADNNKKYDLVRLGKPGTYSIQLEFSWNITFYGIGITDPATSVTALPQTSSLKVMVIGDSYTWPVITESGPYAPWDGYASVLSWLTGWNVMAAGVPGQGYLQPAAGEVYLDRLVRDVAPHDPDVVILTGSPNDHCRECTWSERQIAAQVRADIIALRKAAPRALIILCSPFTAWQSESDEFRAVANELKVPYIDFAASPLFTQANNGQNQLLNGHPTRAGGLHMATQLLAEIAKLK